jgi:hypothetical protein
MDRIGAGRAATGWPTVAGRSGSETGATAGSAAAICVGTSKTRRSGASIRRSSQGKLNPGSQCPSPPKVRLSSDACSRSESSRAYVSGLRSRITRWLKLRPTPAPWGDRAGFRSVAGVSTSVEGPDLNRARPSLSGHRRTGQVGTRAGASVDLVVRPVMLLPILIRIRSTAWSAIISFADSAPDGSTLNAASREARAR